MPDTVYKIYPKDHLFMPEQRDIDRGVEWLREHVPHYDVTYESHAEPQFVHCGENLSHIHCPLCEQEIDTRDWQDLMTAAYETMSFRVLDITLPCCGKKSALNRLTYKLHCGFGRFCYELAPRAGIHVDIRESLHDREVELTEGASAFLKCPAGCGLVAMRL